MNCCDYQCDQGRDCPAHTNATTRTYPRTLAEAFPQDAAFDPIVERYRYSDSLEMWLLLAAAYCAGMVTTLLAMRS
jgi:hypothetical protein